MSVLSSIPKTTKTLFQHGDNHIGVWALQRFFNKIDYTHVAEDGDFGPITEKAVKRYQRATDAKIDGIVGPQTQERIVRSCIVRTLHGTELPRGLAEGLIAGESGRLLAAVNWTVTGGVDCGLTQQRVYGPPFTSDEIAKAFDPIRNVADAVASLYEQYILFIQQPYVKSRSDQREYAWRLAALAHNWPWGAQELSKGHQLSTTREASWVPSNVTFDDGSRVRTWSDWSKFYAIGSKTHKHAGLVTKLAYGIPTTG